MSVVSYAAGEQLNGAIDRFQAVTLPADGAELDFHFPATLRPRLVMITRGAASLVGTDGSCTPLPAAFIAAPMGAPRTYRIMPGTEFIVAILCAGSYNRFFSAPLSGFAQCVIALDELVPGIVRDGLVMRVQAARAPGEALQLLRDFLIGALDRRRKLRSMRLPGLSRQMLSIPRPDLARLLELSERQFERLFRAAYGMPLRDYRQLVRYKNALALVLTRPWERGMVTRIALDCDYFDQSHFIRDFRAFVGCSPGEFMKESRAFAPANSLWRDTARPFMLLDIDCLGAASI